MSSVSAQYTQSGLSPGRSGNLGTTGTERGKHLWVFYRIVWPAVAAGVMLATSLLPWIYDPLGKGLTPWDIAVDLGWQIHIPGLSYGLLCLGCACLSSFIALRSWQARHNPQQLVSRRQCTLTALCCLLPLALFVTQFLFIDMNLVAYLSNREEQMLLIRATFGYGVSPHFVPLKPFMLDPMQLDGRLALLLNQLDGGLFLPFASTLVLIVCQRLFPQRERVRMPARYGKKVLFAGIVLGLIVLGRGPAALACTAHADALLMNGEYTQALNWLDRARVLNPSLEHMSAFHIKRGQAWHFTHPDQPNADSKAYLAAFYRQQFDLLAAYQELQIAHQYAPQAQWIKDEMSITLMRLSDMTHPLKGPMAEKRLDNERRALPWLTRLAQADPENVYAHYTIGRIYLDMNDYAACEHNMRKVLDKSQNREIQSSAYTYLGLSRARQGDVKAARLYLFKAQELDYEYRNNTARQALSGIR